MEYWLWWLGKDIQNYRGERDTVDAEDYVITRFDSQRTLAKSGLNKYGVLYGYYDALRAVLVRDAWPQGCAGLGYFVFLRVYLQFSDNNHVGYHWAA